MCLLIYAKDASLVPDKHIISAYNTNSDGFGIWFVDDGKLQVVKNVYNHPHDALDLWRSRDGRGPVSCHFRMATHGTMNQDNAHPYVITRKEECGRDIVMGHNGVISQVGAMSTRSNGSHPSDSNIFATQYLRPILLKNPKKIDDIEFRKLIGDAISSYNKLIITTSGFDEDGELGTTHIINERSGSWTGENAWYSNQYSISSYRYSMYE